MTAGMTRAEPTADTVMADRCGYCGQEITAEALAYIESIEAAESFEDHEPSDDGDDTDGGLEYVEPTWRSLSSDDPEAELSKCALCNRFFVALCPVRLFQELSDSLVLGFEVCDACAQKVVPLMMRRAGST